MGTAAGIGFVALLFVTLTAGFYAAWRSRAGGGPGLEKIRGLEKSRLADAINCLPQSIQIFDSDDRLVFINQYMHPDIKDIWRPCVTFTEVIRAVAERGLVREAIGREEKWIAERMERHRNPRGNFEQEYSNGRWLLISEYKTDDGGWIIIRTDITEQKQTEESLLEMQEILLKTQVQARIGSFVWDEIEGRELYASDVMKEILGQETTESLGSMAELSDRVHADDREHFERMARQINLTDEPADFEYRIHHPDGEIRYLHERCDPVFDDAGKRIRSVGIVQDITELKRSEIALRESTARLQAFFDNVPSIITVKDVEGRIVLASPSYGEELGIPLEEVIGKTSKELLPGDLGGRLHNSDREVRETGKAVEWEHDIIIDGDTRVRQILKFPVRDGAGNIIATGSISTDVTERKRNEEFLRSIVDSLPQVLNIRDAEGRFVLVNRRLADYFGVQPEEMIGKRSDKSHLPLDTNEQELREIEQVFETGVAITDREYIYEIDGKSENWLTSRQPIFDRAGNLQYVLTVSNNITEAKRAEEALRISEARLSHAHRLAKLGHWWLEPDEERVYASAEMAAIFGVEEFIVNYDEFLEMVHPEDRYLEELIYGPGVEFSDGYEIDYRIIRPDGEWRHIREIGEPYRNADGIVIGETGTVQDITELKQAEAALIAAKEQAEFANRSKSEFLANMSHDLRTPLNAIIGFSDMMKSEILGPVGVPKYREYVDAISESGAHLLDMINAILDLSKIESSSIMLDDDEVDVEGVIDAMLTLVAMKAESSEVELVKNIPAGLPRLTADEVRLKQMLGNLLSNAIKFTPPGGKIRISAECSDDGRLIISVSDTGIGISGDDISLVLEPFSQIDSVMTRKFEGTGLGLPLVSAMIKQHGGELLIESELGVGTVVSIIFPAERVL